MKAKLAEDSLALGIAVRVNLAISIVALLMVFGHLGHLGLNAVKNVVEELQQGQDHAEVQLVEGSLALDKTRKAKHAPVTEFGHPGQLGLHVPKHVVGEVQQEQDPVMGRNVEENLALETTLK